MLSQSFLGGGMSGSTSTSTSTSVDQPRAFTPKPQPTSTVSDMSMPTGDGMKIKSANTTPTEAEARAKYNQGQTAVAGAKLFGEVLNAQSAYNNLKGTVALNMLQIRNQHADALSRGRQAQLDRQSEGYNAGQSAALQMAAQGQDVNGSGVGKIQGSYEAMGVYNGMREEMNSIREAMGYELEESNLKYQLKSAALNKDLSMISSALNFGASAYAYSGG